MDKKVKDIIFSVAKFYDETADYMLKNGNHAQCQEFSYKFDGVMGIIESLNLVEEYEMWRESQDGDEK